MLNKPEIQYFKGQWPAQKTYTFARPPHYFRLESGKYLGPITVAYETYGQLAPDGENGVYIAHALTGTARAGGHSGQEKAGGSRSLARVKSLTPINTLLFVPMSWEDVTAPPVPLPSMKKQACLMLWISLWLPSGIWCGYKNTC